MQLIIVVEMLMDRIAASKIYQGDAYTDRSALDYYNQGRGKVLLHPYTAEKLELLLKKLAEEGEDEAALSEGSASPDTEQKPDFQKRLGLVHRIDKETSGLLVIAKNEDAGTSLSRQFFHKTTRRLYTALVWGHVEEDEGTIVGNIGRNKRDRTLMEYYPEGSEEGKPAVTHYRVIERLGYVTLVECRLETGRTHQIRVHMKHVGHTLFNDKTYGGDQILKGTTFAKYSQFVRNCFDICPRQALHAGTLGFRHPRTGEEMDFEAPLPADMARLVEKWREYVSNRNY